VTWLTVQWMANGRIFFPHPHLARKIPQVQRNSIFVVSQVVLRFLIYLLTVRCTTNNFIYNFICFDATNVILFFHPNDYWICIYRKLKTTRRLRMKSLSMVDPVTAERQFLDRHVQKTHYLSSRECKLAEDLFRAVLSRDSDALNEARSPTGSNKNGLASLHASMRDLVQNLRVSGAARKKRPTSEPATEIQPTTEIKPASEPSAEEKSKGLKLENVDKAEEIKPKDKDSDDKKLDSKKLENELDTVMADLDGIDFGEKEEDDDNDDDDDIDLR